VRRDANEDLKKAEKAGEISQDEQKKMETEVQKDTDAAIKRIDYSSATVKINVDICSNCHPFFTGKQKFVDAAGRVERFSKKFGGTYSFQKAAVPVGPKK